MRENTMASDVQTVTNEIEARQNDLCTHHRLNTTTPPETHSQDCKRTPDVRLISCVRPISILTSPPIAGNSIAFGHGESLRNAPYARFGTSRSIKAEFRTDLVLRVAMRPLGMLLLELRRESAEHSLRARRVVASICRRVRRLHVAPSTSGGTPSDWLADLAFESA